MRRAGRKRRLWMRHLRFYLREKHLDKWAFPLPSMLRAQSRYRAARCRGQHEWWPPGW